MGRKLDRKRGARQHPHMNHSVLQGHQFSVRCRLTTGSPQPIPKLKHSSHMSTLHTSTRTTPTTPQLTPLPVWSGSCCQQVPIAVVCHINQQCLSFDLLPRPKKHVRGVKGHTPWGTHPPKRSFHRIARVACPTRSNITPLVRLTASGRQASEKDGGRKSIRHLTTSKLTSEVHVIRPCPFHCPWSRSFASKA